MRAELLDRPIIALQFLFREQHVDLGMAGPADADGALDLDAWKFALVAFVVMASARDQVMPRENLFAPTDGADAVHTGDRSFGSGGVASNKNDRRGLRRPFSVKRKFSGRKRRRTADQSTENVPPRLSKRP